MKQIVANKPMKEISVAEIGEEPQGLIIQVYAGQVAFLTERPNSAHKVGFRRIDFNEDCNSCSPTVRQVLDLNIIDCHETKIYQFDNLREFARAVIENGWS